MMAGTLLAQTAIPAGADRFQGISPAMPTPAQIVTEDVPAQALLPTPTSIARLVQMTPRMPAPEEIVTEVPPALTKQTLGAPRHATPRERVHEGQPPRAIAPPKDDTAH